MAATSGSFFSPTWFTIPDAEATKNLTLVTNALVRSVLVDQDGMATGVAYVDRATEEGGGGLRQGGGARRVLCRDRAHHAEFDVAHTGPPASPIPAASWDAICASTCTALPGYGYLPQLLGQPATPDNIADSTVAWMPRWQNLTNPREEKFIRGYSVYMGGGCGEFPGYYSQIEGFGTTFKREIKRYYPTPIGALIQAPTLPSPTNYVDIDPEKKDIFGIPQLRFHFQWGQNELLMWEHSKHVMVDLFKAMAWRVVGRRTTNPNRPGTSLHETGVCRFGNDPKTIRDQQVGPGPRRAQPLHL